MRKRYLAGIIILPCLALLVSLLVLSCGGSGSEGLPKRQLPDSATPEKIMLEGLNATDAATSLHFDFNYSVMVPPTGQQTYTSEIKIEGEGDYDAKSGDAEGHMNWPSFETEFNWVLFEGKSYFQVANESWYELPNGSQWTIPSVSEITRNTAEYMDNFEKINRLEDEVVNSRDCYHIALVPNFDAIMSNQQFLDTIKGETSQSNEETAQNIDQLKQELKNATVNYEYWIDKDYLVLRRTLCNVEMVEQGDQNTSYTAKLITEIDFPFYNVKVTVAPPETSMLYQQPSQ
jgi:Family of unknown function (DUF6612)